MDIRLVKFGYKMHLSLEKVRIVQGVNSKVDEDTHFLMWDFDNTPLPVIEASLIAIQEEYNLPKITIISTGKGYHAYCFKACSWLKCRAILAATPFIDTTYVGIGLMRGYFTLRFENSEEFKCVEILPGTTPEDLCYSDVNSFVNYTKRVK